MQCSLRYPLLVGSLAICLSATGPAGSSFPLLSPTSFRINQQGSSSPDAEVTRWASQLKSSNEEERREAAMQLGLVESEAASSALESAIADASPRVRASVVVALARQAKSSSIHVLSTRLTQDKDSFVRKTTAYALAGFQGSERTIALTGALKDKDAEVRASAATALGDHADTGAIAPLSTALADKSDFVRAQAARALGVNGRAAAQAIPALIELLSKDGDNEVKRQAAEALGKIGDRSSLAALERARHDRDPYLVQAAAEAIRLIERGPNN